VPVDARHVPEAGYGNLADGGNVGPGEAETPLLHPSPVSIVEGRIHERIGNSFRVTGSKGGLSFSAGDRVRLLVSQFPHDKSLAVHQRMRHNARHQRRAINFEDEKAADLRVRCMPLLDGDLEQPLLLL
jgi:hypothetical protein